MRKIIFSQEQIEDMIKKYENNWSLNKIAKEYNVSRSVISRVLKEKIQLRKRTTKYKYNQDIFEVIDSSEKAYWLGFLAADGCNYQREHNASIIISLAEKDIELLRKFKTFCGTDAKITTFIADDTGFSNKTCMCRIVLNSTKISNDLINKGIVPKKSLILKPPIISEEYYKPFILGYFDGDGSISKTNQYNNYCISIQGTKEILEWMSKVLKWEVKLEKRHPDSDKNSYYIRCGGTNKPYNILKQLYDSCETHLDRKYKLYKALETVVLDGNIE